MDLRYAAFWDVKKTAALITIIWICGVCLFIFTICGYHLYGFRFERIYPSFIHLPASILYVIFAVASNSIIVYKLNKSRTPPHGATNDNTLSFCEVFTNSRLIVPVSLTLTFLTFHITPITIFTLFKRIKNKKPPTHIQFYFSLSSNVMMLCDSMICIFLEPQVRHLLGRMLRNRQNRIDVENSCNIRDVAYDQRHREDVVPQRETTVPGNIQQPSNDFENNEQTSESL